MRRILIPVVLCAGILLPAQYVIAQQELSTSEKSYRRARQVLDAGIEALGGLEAVRSVQGFTIKEAGTSYAVHGSAKPDPPFSAGRRQGTYIFDPARNRLFFEARIDGTPSFVIRFRTFVKDGAGYNVDLIRRMAVPLENPSLGDYPAMVRRLPHNILLEALGRASTLRWVGEDEFKGRQQRAISYVRGNGELLTLSFDAETNLLTKFERLLTGNISGDTVAGQIYPGYRTLGKIKIPTGRIAYQWGYVTDEMEYTDVQLNSRPDDKLFEVPAGIPKLSVTDPQPTVSKLSPDVYVLRDLPDGYNIFFVAFNDYLLVVEGVESNTISGLSEQAIAKIKETVPGKPIKYLIQTHHHGDHAGGVRTYIAEGATIVTTPGNKSFFERLAATHFLMTADALTRNPHRPVIEVVKNKTRVFRDDQHLVEVHDIGPIPHAEEMLIVYLPKEKILVQADLFNPITPGQGPIARHDTYHPIFAGDELKLVESIKRLGLQVERIVGVHGRVTTFKELSDSVLESAKRR